MVIGYASTRFLCLLGMTKLKYVAEGSPSREKVSPEHPYQLPHSFVALLPNAGGTRGQGGWPVPSSRIAEAKPGTDSFPRNVFWKLKKLNRFVISVLKVV